MAEFIVAIELGSSKMTGIAGTKNSDGSISILAVVTENSTACIRKGVVYNINKTEQCLSNIIKRLEDILKVNIAKVYIGLGGLSILSKKNVIVKDLPTDTIIESELVNNLIDTNKEDDPELEIIDIAIQEYKVDKQYQTDPIGIQCSHLEGNILNLVCKKKFYNNIKKCCDDANISIEEYYLAPLALADCVLAENEKRNGCVLVDLGAETTTVAVYYKNILRQLSVIPLGSNNITKDIATFPMEDTEAEDLKLCHGSAFTESKDIDESTFYNVTAGKVSSSWLINCIEARIEEIVLNVWEQVPDDFKAKLVGGIILTGGGSNMLNIEKAFSNKTGIEKIRIAKFVNLNIKSSDPIITEHNGMMNTILGLLAKGNASCAGKDIIETGTPVNTVQQQASTVIPTKEQKPVVEQQAMVEESKPKAFGTVLTPSERKKQEEEDRRKAEENERKAREEAERLRSEAEKKRHDNSFFNKFRKKLKNFGNEILTGDDE
nr:cell division protein FtsA [Prevotella sp.]